MYRIPVTPVSGNAAASRLVRERFIVAFEAGIVQEIHIGEVPSVQINIAIFCLGLALENWNSIGQLSRVRVVFQGLLLDGNGALPEAGPTPTVGWYSPAQIERALGPIERANATAVF
eukprot:SAG31_NODE_2368_length_5854_cov_19.043440_4_plen_117_part_00